MGRVNFDILQLLSSIDSRLGDKKIYAGIQLREGLLLSSSFSSIAKLVRSSGNLLMLLLFRFKISTLQKYCAILSMDKSLLCERLILFTDLNSPYLHLKILSLLRFLWLRVIEFFSSFMHERKYLGSM